MSDTFAAVAPVGGVLVFPECRPQEPVSVIHFTDGSTMSFRTKAAAP